MCASFVRIITSAALQWGLHGRAFQNISIREREREIKNYPASEIRRIFCAFSCFFLEILIRKGSCTRIHSHTYTLVLECQWFYNNYLKYLVAFVILVYHHKVMQRNVTLTKISSFKFSKIWMDKLLNFFLKIS